MKLLLYATLAAALIIVPFYKMRARWAVDLWRKLKLVIIAYCLIVFLSALARLIFNFDAIYG